MNMKLKQYFIPLALPLVLFSGCGAEVEEASLEDLVRSVNVEVVEVEPENFSSYLRLVGTVNTSNDVIISSEVSGRVVEFYRREGSRVRNGEPIVKIDDQRLRQEVRRQQAVTEQSRENYERLQRLYATDNIGSEMDVINARFTWEQNQAALEGLQVDLENTTIRAPFDGEVDRIDVETGEMVSIGTPVLRMISRTGLKVTLGVPARYSDVVDSGDEAEVWFDFAPERRYRLPIIFVGRSIDPRNRTFKVDLALPENLDHLKVDMLANVRLRTEFLEDVVVIGEEYVFRKEGRHVAYVAGENEQGQAVARERTLRIGPGFGGRLVVQEGLEPGDRLITAGSSYLQEMSRIRIVENEEGAVAGQVR